MRCVKFILSPRGVSEPLSNKLRSRRLRREAIQVGTQKFWRRRDRSESRRRKFLEFRFRMRTQIVTARNDFGIFRRSVASIFSVSVVLTLLLSALAVVSEAALVCYFGLSLIPSNPDIALGTFPTIAVPVTAALLGFYLATVGIVLGSAYHDVSSAVRQLILENREIRLYLTLVSIAITTGLAIILINNTRIFTIGYLVIGAYALLVCFSGWALVRLALGAFDLFNPIALAEEPLKRLYRSITHLDSKGFLSDDAILRSTALNADRTLATLTEVIRLTKERTSVSRDQLANVAELLLTQVRFYTLRKHQLKPDSGWFIPTLAYPRWVESSESTREIALKTSTPLQVEYSPVPDWVERRAADLVCIMLEACVVTNDRDAALRIIYAASDTAQRLAACSRVDEAIAFSQTISNSIWNSDLDNETMDILLSQPLVLMTGVLLGWKNGISTWRDEIIRVVDATNWDSHKTTEVQIRAPSRVSQAAQHLLQQVHSERVIEGYRVTPDWYLRAALASECILSFSEFADSIQGTLHRYIDALSSGQFSPKAKALAGAEAMQMLSKADLVAETIGNTVENLVDLQKGLISDIPTEIDSLPDRIVDLRSVVLLQLAHALEHLNPEQVKSEPDYFGQTLFTLLYHLEQAIADGRSMISTCVFENTLVASLKLYRHLRSTYRPPSYEFTPAILNPIVDILEISGLAIIYEQLRGDKSAEPIREAWNNWKNSLVESAGCLNTILNVLDMATGVYPHMSIMRMNWATRLATRIMESGYAESDYSPFGDASVEDPPPPLIKILGVMGAGSTLSLDPCIIFAGEVIAPMSGQSDVQLRARQGLRRYYDSQIDNNGGV